MKDLRGTQRNKTIVLLVLVAALVLTALGTPQKSPAQPDFNVSVDQFNSYIKDWSEPEGYFDTDNFISNETSYEQVIGDLRKSGHTGGVYLGVGPDQNFTYIAHTRPSLAIIVDIRRQNMLQHLLFKALFDQAMSRSDFLALMFGKEKPAVARNASFKDVLIAVRAAPTSEATFQRDLVAAKSIISGKYKFPLMPDDIRKIDYVYRSFWKDNLDLRFESLGRGNASQYPTFESLLLQTDRNGQMENYLSSDELFQWMKTFEGQNRLIPIVGDFGGTHAFAAAAKFLKDSHAEVSTFYTSNVEFYLFDTPAWKAFMNNVRLLPVNADSVFIRAYFPTYGRPHPLNVAGYRPTTLVHRIVPFIKDYEAGRIPTYWEVVQRPQ